MDSVGQSTKERLMRAAAEIFAESGYKATTIREICKKAEANVAAINYHFGGKEQLYMAMLEHYLLCSTARYPLDAGLRPDAPPVERLLAFVRALLRRSVNKEDPAEAAHGKLILKEIVDPTPMFRQIVAEHFQPIQKRLEGILRDILPPDVSEDDLEMCSTAILGHISFYARGHSILGHTVTRDSVDDFAERLTSLALDGVKGMAAGRFSRPLLRAVGR